ncbi:CsbD family protein [Streptomyces sp. NBC_00233]|uniref:CsbD family protein n=1 Tax=Streptomyces sp. NBC_00233 TaxID=2975686 RepID=UPI002259A567|nr:CsbD family protein [Streptomyces sp. NBC_00233]MCX5232717.1 CsbD family protein [Streptomyces sp. NBC_00233]
MSGTEKSRAHVEQVKGTAKEAVGAVGNERLTVEGHADRTKGKARETKEDVKDNFRH